MSPDGDPESRSGSHGFRTGDPGIRNVEPEEAERLVRDGAVRVLDVRSPEEYRELGHIPGAILLPVELIPSAPAILPRDGKPLLVYCEHGIRSVAAVRFLAQAGFEGLLNLAGGLSCWSGPRDYEPAECSAGAGPSSWLVENADLLPRGGRALDVACGRGRHALLLGAAGFQVRALDRDAAAIAELSEIARRLDLPVRAEAIDLEAEGVDLGEETYDLIAVLRFLHRPLFPALRRALRSGGLLLCETYTTAQAARGKPTNPAFLLKPGELRTLAAPLEILRDREGEFDGGMVAAIAARKTG
jgi:rhodanese-related sulfurtransferase